MLYWFRLFSHKNVSSTTINGARTRIVVRIDLNLTLYVRDSPIILLRSEIASICSKCRQTSRENMGNCVVACLIGRYCNLIELTPLVLV